MQELVLEVNKDLSFDKDGLLQQINEGLEYYRNAEYTEDTMYKAKQDRATLNKFRKAIDDKKKEVKKVCLAPYEAFEKDVKELLAAVDEPIALIDGQVKDYEQKEKAEKYEKCKEVFDGLNTYEWLKFEQIFKSEWTNKSTSMKKVSEAIGDLLEHIRDDVLALGDNDVALAFYRESLSVTKSLERAKFMAEINDKIPHFPKREDKEYLPFGDHTYIVKFIGDETDARKVDEFLNQLHLDHSIREE